MNLYITFGVKYCDEYHPCLGNVVDAHSIVKVTAPTEEEARQFATNLLTPAGSNVPAYAGAYTWTDQELDRAIANYYPRGVVLEIGAVR